MKKRAILFIVIAGICWGTSGIFVHYLAPYGFTSNQMTAVRALVSTLFILTYSLARDRSLFRIKPLHAFLLLGVGASLFLTASFYYSAMQLTSVSTAVILMYAAPIYVMIFSLLFWKERLTKWKALSIVCMVIGCCLVAGIANGFAFHAKGILLGTLSGFSYATYNILTKVAIQCKVKPISVTLYCFLFMSLISLFVLEPQRASESIAMAPRTVLPLLIGLGICTFVIPYVLYTLAMKDLSAGTASALSIVEPMAATLFSVLLFREPLDWYSGVGIVLILGAILVIGKTEQNEEETT